MTRSPALCVIAALTICLSACGSDTGPTNDQDATPDTELTVNGMPDDDIHADAMSSVMGGGDHAMGINRDVHLSDEIRSAWRGVTIRVVDTTDDSDQVFDVGLGSTVALADTGIELTAETFIPAFVMDDSGITSSSAEASNPAVRVVITEDGEEPYHGWLFAAMPGIHPFPHDRYQVLLVEGIPAE
jgi:hypothetical protein